MTHNPLFRSHARKALAAFVVLAMLLAQCPPVMAQEQAPPPYQESHPLYWAKDPYGRLDLYTQLSDEGFSEPYTKGKSETLGGEGWSFDGETLIFNNFNYVSTHGNFGLVFYEDATLTLVGENSICHQGNGSNSAQSYGIELLSSDGQGRKLHITGEGSLSVTTTPKGSGGTKAAIYLNADSSTLTVSGATLTAQAYDGNVHTYGLKASAYSQLIVKDGAQVQLIGGEKATDYDKSYGIYIRDDSDARKSAPFVVEGKGTKLIANGATSAVYVYSSGEPPCPEPDLSEDSDYPHVAWGCSDYSGDDTKGNSGPVLWKTLDHVTKFYNKEDRDYTIVIRYLRIAERPTIRTDTTLPRGTVGSSYRLQFTATGNQEFPIVWRASTRDLPPGFELDLFTGVLSGTPTQIGTWTFKVTAVSDQGLHYEDFTLRIDEPDRKGIDGIPGDSGDGLAHIDEGEGGTADASGSPAPGGSPQTGDSAGSLALWGMLLLLSCGMLATAATMRRRQR